MNRRIAFAVGAVAVVAGLAPGSAQAIRPIPAYTKAVIDSPTPEPSGFQGFGIALMKAGDVDRDGVGDIVTSNSAQTVNGVAGVGRGWVFSGRTRQVILTLEHPEPQAGAGFARSVVGIGDVNDDGVPDIEAAANSQDIFVGTPGPGQGCGLPEPNGCNENQGKAYVFSGATGGLLYSISDPVPQVGANFGFFYVAGPGDLNGDGTPDLVMAARQEDVAGVVDSGAAYAFNGKNGALLYRIDNPFPQTNARLGGGMGDPGDVNGDGVDDIVIGASGANVGPNAGQGRAYVFSGRTGFHLLTLNDPEPQMGASFGATLGGRGAPGDVNGDGVRDIYVNATQQGFQGLPAAGLGYLFSGKDGSFIRNIEDPTPQTDGGFGFAYDDAGDLNGDGTNDLLVGQFTSNNPNSYSSGAWVFDPRTGRVLASFEGTFDGPGDTLASPGDVNGDACPDYFIGGPSMDVGSNLNQGRITVELSQTSPPGCATVAQAPPPAYSQPSPSAPFAGCPASATNVINGTAAADTITGTAAGDRIFAGTGNDIVDSVAGDDCDDLGPGADRGQGGPGRDLILGGIGRDRISGGPGNDRIRGNPDNDRLDGGDGNDSVVGDAGNDVVLGGAGNDVLHGVSGNDRVSGSEGRDKINGGSGKDRISGGSSGDRIAGDAGGDSVSGNSGNDTLRGNSGSDRISGGSGRDTISGGLGNDSIGARDGKRDKISCGRGRDTVSADRIDRVAADCERVSRR